MDHGKEVPAEFFEPCGQSSHVLHGAEEALDDVAHPVEIGVVRYRRFGVDLRRNDRERALISYGFSNRAGVIGLIGDDCQRRSRAVQQVRQNLAVMNLAAGDDKTPGAAMLIDYGVNFARAASS